MGFNGFYWVLLGCYGFGLVIIEIYRFFFADGGRLDWRIQVRRRHPSATPGVAFHRRSRHSSPPYCIWSVFFCLYRVLLGFYRVEPGRKRFDRVFQGCSLSTSVLLGFTEFFWVFMVFLYGIDLCGMSLTFGAVWLGNSGKELELEIVRCQCVRTWKSRERLGQSKVR